MANEIKNLKEAALRIKRAIEKGEKIILYGDVDLDGVTSLIILKESIRNLGGREILVYFPNLEEEGYGLDKKALDFLKKESPALLILLDCGISNFNEIELANSLGFEIIVIDHHEVLDRLPKASIVVDPKQKGDEYSFKDLATSGITFKLAEILLGEKMTGSLRKNFLELVAISTIADMMPEKEDNELMITEGLILLENTARPGLKAFLEMDEIKGYASTRELVQKIISTLNIAEVKNHLNDAYLLLTSTSVEEAKKMVRVLLGKREQRQRRIMEINEEIERMIIDKEKNNIIFEWSADWPIPLLGSIASRICNKFQKPTFIISKRENKSRGSVRVPKGMNGVEAMKACSEFLEGFGGHPPAAGFTIKNENLDKFKECLMEYFKKDAA